MRGRDIFFLIVLIVQLILFWLVLMTFSIVIEETFGWTDSMTTVLSLFVLTTGIIEWMIYKNKGVNQNDK